MGDDARYRSFLSHLNVPFGSRSEEDPSLIPSSSGDTIGRSRRSRGNQERRRLQRESGCIMHPALAPLSYLLGRWRGEGEGGFPTINSFRYGEELTFSHSGKPVMAYTQKTWKLDSGEPMHAGSGYWRPKPDGSVEVVIAQSTGLVEVQKGAYDAENKVIKLKSEVVGNASKVKEITQRFWGG